MKKGHKYGTHRVISPKGVLPQPADKLDNNMDEIYDNEILIDVQTLNIDSASFTQISNQAGGDKAKIAEIMLDIVEKQGKHRNPVTGSGGMLLGTVEKIGDALVGKTDLKVGDKIATLVSLSLTPLRIDKIKEIRPDVDQVDIDGKAILFESGIYAKIPSDLPEKLVMSALEGLDVMLNDALYGILFRDINMQRTLVDQYMSRVINGFAGVIINTGEDNYLTTADAVEEAHTVLASDLINEQLALLAGLPEEQMGLGHAFEMDPMLENGFLYELAQAQMTREIFPKAPLKYMPPTKFMTGNIFRGHIQDALFNMVGIWTSQGIQLLGMPTEAIHTPFMSDRYLSIENARYIFNNMKNIGDEVEFKEGGLIRKRAKEVLDKATALLERLEKEGLFSALEKGIFADIKRPMNGGKGLEGVSSKGRNYYNPFVEIMKNGSRAAAKK